MINFLREGGLGNTVITGALQMLLVAIYLSSLFMFPFVYSLKLYASKMHNKSS